MASVNGMGTECIAGTPSESSHHAIIARSTRGLEAFIKLAAGTFGHDPGIASMSPSHPIFTPPLAGRIS